MLVNNLKIDLNLNVIKNLRNAGCLIIEPNALAVITDEL
jgi:hypothetical protein